MASTDTTALAVALREPSGSRSARRLRRDGKVPGVVYGGGDEPVAFEVDARVLRNTLSHSRAVLDLSIDGGAATPVVVKDHARHPVSGETVHIDLLRVSLDKPIQATVVLELVGAEDAPGVREGGILEQITREVTVEALPTSIPDTVQHDVSGVQIGDTLTLGAVTAPPGVTLVDDPETVIAIVSAPRLQAETEVEIEEEVERVAEGAAAEGGEDAGQAAEDEGGE